MKPVDVKSRINIYFNKENHVIILEYKNIKTQMFTRQIGLKNFL